MGERATKQFNKRFEDRIEIQFAESPLSPSEQEYRNKCLRNAITDIFTGLLGRKPTDDELSGRADISALMKTSRKKKGLNY